MGACGGWLRDHSQALDPRRGQSTQGQGYSSYWSACVDVSDAAECWAHADAPQAGYGGSLAVFDSADYYGDATFCCGGRDNPPCDSPGGVYGEIGNFGTPEYLAAVSEYVPCTPVGPIGSSGSDETGCRNNGGDGTPAEYGCMGCGPARWQRRQERFRQGYIDFIIAAWDDAFGSQRNEEEPRKTWMPGDPPPPPPTSWFDSPSCFPQPAGPEWWREADPWYGLCVFKWNVFGGFQGYSVPVCSRDAFFRGECFAMEWRGSGSLTTWSSKNTGSPPYMPSWHCGVDPVSGEGGCFHEDPRIVGYGYFNQALAEEGGPWADGTVYQGEFCNGWCQPTMIGTWWPPTKVTHPFGDKADCEGNNTNLSHHGTGGCGNAELYLCESWHQPDGKCVDVTPRRNHWVRGKWVVDDPMPAEECPPEPSGCDTRNATSLEECEKALPACGFVYVSPKQWSCVEPEPGEGKRCVEVPAGEGESGETYYQSLKTCEEDCKNECAIEKTFQIKKGQTYVIEVDTNSVDKFNHKNHWWEIGFYKKTTETKTTGGGLGCWCSGGGQQVDPITGLPTGEPSWACTAGSGVWPMWHYDTLEKCENDCTAEFHEECVISEPLETEVTIYNPAWNISTESVTNCPWARCSIYPADLPLRVTESLDEVIRSLLASNNGTPYAMAAVMVGGELLYSNYLSAGYVEALSSEPVGRTASIGKAVCGAAIGTLYDKGLLSPTDKLVELLPEYFYNSSGEKLFIDDRYEQITVEYLASMQGGWNRGIFEPDALGHSFEGGDDPTFMDFHIATDLSKMFPDEYPNGIELPIKLKHIIQWETQRALDFTPGTGSANASNGEYSNYGFALLAEIIRKKTGQRYDVYIKNAILNPLGIRLIQMVDKESTGPNADPNLWPFADWGFRWDPWEGYCNEFGCWNDDNGARFAGETTAPYYDAIPRFGYGDLLSTASDYVKFLTLFENTESSNKILSAATKELMFRRRPHHGNESAYYAYGQQINGAAYEGAGDGSYADHGGYVSGSTSMFQRHINTRLTRKFCNLPINIVVFLNIKPYGNPVGSGAMANAIENALWALVLEIESEEN